MLTSRRHMFIISLWIYCTFSYSTENLWGFKNKCLYHFRGVCSWDIFDSINICSHRTFFFIHEHQSLILSGWIRAFLHEGSISGWIHNCAWNRLAKCKFLLTCQGQCHFFCSEKGKKRRHLTSKMLFMKGLELGQLVSINMKESPGEFKGPP